MRTRLTLALGSIAALMAFILGTSGSPADAVSRPPQASTKHRLPTRTHTRVVDQATARDDAELPRVAVSVELSHDLSDAILPPSLLMPEWDPELAWPMPEELPDDSVVFALQDVMLTESGTDLYEDALDELDLALVHSPSPSDPWAYVARLEAERQLARASYHDDLIDHDQRLIEWSDSGGHGPRPDLPAAWTAEGLASDALELARSIDAHADDPEAADVARLTAASVLLDWESASFNENIGADAVLDVIHHTNDPAMLAAAIDLLVGTTVELSDATLDELNQVSSDLPAPTATRLAWFLAGRYLAAGSPEDALAAIDDGIANSTSYTADTLDTMWARDALTAGRGSLLGMSGRIGGRSLHESVQAAAWHCWVKLIEADDAWTVDGTAYQARAVVSPDGVQWLDQTDENPHFDCISDMSRSIVLPQQPVQLQIEIEPVHH